MRHVVSVLRNPLNNFFPSGNGFESLLNDLVMPRWPIRQYNVSEVAAPKMEPNVQDGRLYIKMDLPGVNPQDVDIVLEGDLLKISGERKDQRNQPVDKYLSEEIAYGSFSRSLTLPKGVDASGIEASAKNGTLNVVVPFPENAKSKPIAIKIKDD